VKCQQAMLWIIACCGAACILGKRLRPVALHRATATKVRTVTLIDQAR
jgi:hypothetical protein